jgi:hypothetical protein
MENICVHIDDGQENYNHCNRNDCFVLLYRCSLQFCEPNRLSLFYFVVCDFREREREREKNREDS